MSGCHRHAYSMRLTFQSGRRGYCHSIEVRRRPGQVLLVWAQPREAQSRACVEPVRLAVAPSAR